MLLIRVVASITSFRTVRVNFRFASVRRMAPKAPIAAASVGEAIPKKIDPRTARIKKAGGTRAFAT